MVGQRLAGNRNDCKAWEEFDAKAAVGNIVTIADDGYPGTEPVIPHRRQRGQAELPDWKTSPSLDGQAGVGRTAANHAGRPEAHTDKPSDGGPVWRAVTSNPRTWVLQRCPRKTPRLRSWQ